MYGRNALVPKSGTLLAPQLDYILLDGSGSMAGKWYDTLAGLESFIDVLKAENINSHGIIHVFDTAQIEYIQRDSCIADWASFRAAPLQLPGGGTPFYDAINLMGRRIAELNPPRASIVIVTDGLETSSRVTDETQARAILDWLRAKGYQVTFLGADFANSHQAKLLGADASNTLAIQKKRLSDAGKLLGEKRVDNARSGRPINFSDAEKTDFGGYLAAPEK